MAENGNGLKPSRVGRYAVGGFIALLTTFLVYGMMFQFAMEVGAAILGPPSRTL